MIKKFDEFKEVNEIFVTFSDLAKTKEAKKVGVKNFIIDAVTNIIVSKYNIQDMHFENIQQDDTIDACYELWEEKDYTLEEMVLDLMDNHVIPDCCDSIREWWGDCEDDKIRDAFWDWSRNLTDNQLANIYFGNELYEIIELAQKFKDIVDKVNEIK